MNWIKTRKSIKTKTGIEPADWKKWVYDKRQLSATW